MLADKLQLRVITPNAIKLDKKIDFVIMRSTTGEMGFLPGHEGRSYNLEFCTMRIFAGGAERMMAVHGGLAEIKKNEVIVLTPAAEWPDDIDKAQAEESVKEAERKLQGKSDIMEAYAHAEALRRAQVRLDVCQFAQSGDAEWDEAV